MPFQTMTATPGSRVAGIVQQIYPDHIVISTLDNNLVRVFSDQVSDYIGAQQEGSEDIPELSELFNVGQFVPTVILGQAKKRAIASLRPSAVNAFLEEDQITPGSIQWCEVTSCEDHGYSLSFLGPNNHRERLSGLESMALESTSIRSAFLPVDTTETILNIGQPILVRVDAVSSAGIRASLTDIVDAAAKLSKTSSIEDLAILQLHKRCKIVKILPTGMIINIKDIAHAFVTPAHYPQGQFDEKYTPHARIVSIDPITKEIYASCAPHIINMESTPIYENGAIVEELNIVSISDKTGAKLEKDGVSFYLPTALLSDAKKPVFEEKHAPGNVLDKVRVMKYIMMDNSYLVSAKKSVVESEIASFSQLHAGMKVSGVVQAVVCENRGFIIKIAEGITGILPISQVSDQAKTYMSTTERKALDKFLSHASPYHVGNHIKTMILSVDHANQRITFTCKQSIMEATNIPASLDEIKLNGVYTGWVSHRALKSGLTFVKFFNELTAAIPAKHSTDLVLGQAIEVKVKNLDTEYDPVRILCFPANSTSTPNYDSVLDIGTSTTFQINNFSKDGQFAYGFLPEHNNQAASIHVVDLPNLSNHNVGDSFEATVIQNSPLMLSGRDDRLDLSEANLGRRVPAFIKALTTAGVIVAVSHNIDAVVPFSLLSDKYIAREALKTLLPIHKVFFCRLLEVKRDQYVASFKQSMVQYRTGPIFVKNIKEGDCYNGIVQKILENRGVFVRINNSYPPSDALARPEDALDLVDNTMASSINLEEHFKVGERVVLRILQGGKRIRCALRPSIFADGAKPKDDVLDLTDYILDLSPPVQKEEASENSEESSEEVSESSESSENETSEELDWATVTKKERVTTKTADNITAKSRRSNDMTEEQIESIEMSHLTSTLAKSYEDFQKLIASEPSNSAYWTALAAYHAEAGELEKARSTLLQALASIVQTAEADRINAWIALLNYDYHYSPKEVFAATLTEARNNSNHLKLYLALFTALSEADVAVVRNIYNDAARDAECKIAPAFWKRYVEYEVKQNDLGNAARVLDRARQQLNNKDLTAVLIEYFKALFNNGHQETSRTEFEKFLSNNPKKTTVWKIYADLETRVEEYERAKNIWDRATALTLSKSDMKFLYKNAFEFAEMIDDEEFVEQIKSRAKEFTKK